MTYLVLALMMHELRWQITWLVRLVEGYTQMIVQWEQGVH